jgi:hypothetical protein
VFFRRIETTEAIAGLDTPFAKTDQGYSTSGH